MELALPVNRFEDGANKIYKELYAIDKRLENCINLEEIAKYNSKVNYLYNELIKIQIALNGEKNYMPAEVYAKYQRLINSAFIKINTLEKKFNNARKTTTKWAKQSKLSSINDTLWFTSDDLTI